MGRYKQYAFTLPEILISLFLASVISLAIIQCFLVAKQVWADQFALNRMTANQIFFNHRISHGIYHAGNMGCASLRSHLTFYGDESILDSLLGDHAVQILTIGELKKNPYVHRSIISRINHELPILWIKYLDEMVSINQVELKKGQVMIQGLKSWSKGTHLILSDCAGAILLELTQDSVLKKAKNQSLLTFKPISETIAHHFDQQAQIGQLQSLLYFIADNQRFADDSKQKWSLYESNLGRATHELMDGVEYWQVHILTDGSPKHMIQAHNPIGIKVDTVFNSVDVLSATPKPFQFLDYKAEDHLYRTASSQTLLIRGWA